MEAMPPAFCNTFGLEDLSSQSSTSFFCILCFLIFYQSAGFSVLTNPSLKITVFFHPGIVTVTINRTEKMPVTSLRPVLALVNLIVCIIGSVGLILHCFHLEYPPMPIENECSEWSHLASSQDKCQGVQDGVDWMFLFSVYFSENEACFFLGIISLIMLFWGAILRNEAYK